MKRAISLGLAIVLLAGCAHAPPRVQHEKSLERYLPYADAPVDRVTSFRLDSWEWVGQDRIVLWTGVNEAYLVTVYSTCRDLQYANHIRLETSMSGTFSRFDKVRLGRDTCPIREIRPIDVVRMKADEKAP